MGKIGLEECSFAPVEANEEGAAKISMAHALLLRDDIAFVATGSSCCLRGLYETASRLGRENQFFHCLGSEADYASGVMAERTAALVEKICRIDGVGGIVIYASCMDILAKTDFESAVSKITNERQLPIRVLERGPLAPRSSTPKERLTKLLEAIPEKQTTIAATPLQLPPSPPDVHVLSAALQNMNEYIFLLSPGGCAGGLLDTGEWVERYSVHRSRMNNIMIASGAEETMVEWLQQDLPSRGKKLAVLLNSITPHAVGMDKEVLIEAVESMGVDALYVPTRGLPGGQRLLSETWVKLAKRYEAPAVSSPKRVNILGFSPAAMGPERLYHHGLEHLEKLGLQGVYWGSDGIEKLPESFGAALNWVVSTEGLALAEWMKEKYAVPYISGIPLGAAGMNAWVRAVAASTGAEAPAPMPAECCEAREAKVLICGEPMLAMSLREAMAREFGFVHCRIALWNPDKQLAGYYRACYPGEKFDFFTDREQFVSLLDGIDVLVGDRNLIRVAHSINPRIQTVHIPDPMLSGTKYLRSGYAVFGKKGLAWVRQELERENDHVS